MLRADDSGSVGDHVTNKATDLTFSGLAGTGVEGESGPGNRVTLFIDGVAGPEVTANDQGVYRFTGVNLASRAMAHHAARQVAGPWPGDGVGLPPGHGGHREARRAGAPVRAEPASPTGAQQLRAVYHVGEGATLQARVEHLNPTNTVRTFALRNKAAAGLAEFVWNGKSGAGSDVQPGRYRMVLKVTDKAGNVTIQRNVLA